MKKHYPDRPVLVALAERQRHREEARQEKQRRALQLRAEGLTYATIAQRLGVSPNQVRIWVTP